MRKESDFDKALRLKGYGSYKGISNSGYKKIEQVKEADGGLRVQPKIISSLRDYIDFIGSLESTYENPVFYRGQGIADYLINPNSLRISPSNEQPMIEAFSRKFSNEIDSCENDMARLVLMQHFGLKTRALDITENPLAALYFACSPMKKFNTNPQKELDSWGEITIFQDPEDEPVEGSKKPDDLKPIHSTTVSILSSTAFMDNDFTLWHLGMEWKKDNNYMRNEVYIPLKDIVRRSVIVRVPPNNPRIKNQQGAFIIVNANEVTAIGGDEKRAVELTKYILERRNLTFNELQKSDNKWKPIFGNLETWELNFRKIQPYSDSNRIKIFDTDPFDLRRLFYKKDGIQQVALIPSECKKKIVRELERFNITEDFIYPDMDNVANEINLKVNVKRIG